MTVTNRPVRRHQFSPRPCRDLFSRALALELSFSKPPIRPEFLLRTSAPLKRNKRHLGNSRLQQIKPPRRRIDFFGDGPRIPLVAVSPYSTGGHVAHSYTDHVSILKFIERNWHLKPLTGRSRDHLPNPRVPKHNPYVPVNTPAIGDLFDMFDFDDGDHDSEDLGG